MAMFTSVCMTNFTHYPGVLIERTTGQILMGDSSFNRKYLEHETFLQFFIDIERSIYRFSIDNCIDFWRILEYSNSRLEWSRMLHIIPDQFCALNTNPALVSRKFISIYRCSIDKYIDFWPILRYSHVAYHFGSVLGPEHESILFYSILYLFTQGWSSNIHELNTLSAPDWIH